jgi:hypothetical protein
MISGSDREYWQNRTGTWAVESARKDGAVLSLTFDNVDDGPGHSSATWQLQLGRFSSLIEQKHLKVARPSGMFLLRAVTELGGDVEFIPRIEYARHLEAVGIQPNPSELLCLGLFDARWPFVRFVKSEMPNASVRDILWLVMLRVPQNYIRDMLRVLPETSASDLGILYKGEVSASLAKAALVLSDRTVDSADLRVLAASDVNVRYLRGLIDLGYRRLSIAEVVLLRSGAITVAKIGELRDRLKRLPTIREILSASALSRSPGKPRGPKDLA